MLIVPLIFIATWKYLKNGFILISTSQIVLMLTYVFRLLFLIDATLTSWILRSTHHQRWLHNHMVNENLCEYLFDKPIW